MDVIFSSLGWDFLGSCLNFSDFYDGVMKALFRLNEANTDLQPISWISMVFLDTSSKYEPEPI